MGMKKSILFVIGVVVALFLLGLFIGGRGYGGPGYGSWGMMGPGMMGGWGFSPFGWLGMIFMWLIPIGFFVLAVFGIAWLVRNVGGGNKLATPTVACPSCKLNVQPEWKNCAYCVTSLD